MGGKVQNTKPQLGILDDLDQTTRDRISRTLRAESVRADLFEVSTAEFLGFRLRLRAGFQGSIREREHGMDDENLAWAIVLPTAVQAVAIAAAEAAWGPVFGGELAAPVEVRALPNGRCALVGDTPGMAGITDLWAKAICTRLGVAGEVVDLDPDLDLALAFSKEGKSRRLWQGAGVRAEEVGLVTPPPPDVLLCVVEGTSPETVAALYHAARPRGRSFAMHAHPLGTLVLPDAEGKGPDAIFSALGRAPQIRAWLLRWPSDGSLYVLLQAPGGRLVPRHFPPGLGDQDLSPYLDANTADEVCAKLQVTKPGA